MKKNLGVVPALYPMPVLMIATYDENGKVDTEHLHTVVGKIVNAAEEGVLSENGKVDLAKLGTTVQS